MYRLIQFNIIMLFWGRAQPSVITSARVQS